MRIALDTNILAYAEGVNGGVRRDAALGLIARLPDDDVYVPAQALGELFNVLVAKVRLPARDARQRILALRDTFLIIATSPASLMAALDVATDHQLNVWNSLILAAAASVGCQMLLSEDMQDGFVWGGVTIVNPFATVVNPRLRTLLGDVRP